MNLLKPTDFKDMQFVCSAPTPRAFPDPEGPEIAFAGRSNAGKSSALNAICERVGLARTSKTPGRTQAINFFESGPLRFADLPGYGYARVPPATKAAWQALIEGYLSGRTTLTGVVLIMDARRPLTAFDRQFLDWGTRFGLAFHLILTKADKLSRNQQIKALRGVEQEIEGATMQLFSASKRQGIDEARAAIATLASAPDQ
ncbi:ribosome biogenesis GTP-binding protein YihA/YsxC [Salinisphaera aquimarina]|uniref:Probable GTP-binding protein EngB n=1 Tax=Salinisphaera aquimarina TaxID=2094031 RepID=A0ABV7EM89_9GAMM